MLSLLCISTTTFPHSTPFPPFQVHALLAWANASPRGLLLFVDEAESALPDRRAASGVSEVAQNVLNTFLYHTGAQSSQFMLVLATNRPSDLDEALLDRMDEVLPKAKENHYICVVLKWSHEKNIFF